jgi:two-component system, OmpR family, KDP operon response regulator KdpE
MILIVEDESDLADTCLRLLRRHGWTAVVAPTRAAAMSALPERPSLAIIDWRLPDGDGLDVLREAVAAGTPAIMMSGHDWVDTRRVALDAGGAGFLGKPFSAQGLLELVDAILGPAPGPSGNAGQRPNC